MAKKQTVKFFCGHSVLQWNTQNLRLDLNELVNGLEILLNTLKYVFAYQYKPYMLPEFFKFQMIKPIFVSVLFFALSYAIRCKPCNVLFDGSSKKCHDVRFFIEPNLFLYKQLL